MSRAPDGPRGFGRSSETRAERYLRDAGYDFVGRNVRGPGGEIDLIVRRGRLIVFVEVKARANATFGSALAAVDARKRKRIRAAAADFLQMHAPHARVRFDVIAIDGDAVHHHRAAF